MFTHSVSIVISYGNINYNSIEYVIDNVKIKFQTVV